MNMNELLNAVMALDLDPIKVKLMHVQSGEGWSLEKANAVEKEYRRFLCLMKLYPDADTAPLVDVDTFWHYHILDTMKYALDCERAFGYFLHHYPYVGLRGEDDEQFRIDSGERMRALYETTFGEAYPALAGVLQPAQDDRAGYRPAGVPALTAWCAGPAAKQIGNVFATATAWCAGPAARKGELAANSATAWCAGPAARQAANADTAWCAGPAARQAANAATAWCAGPAARTLQDRQSLDKLAA